MHPDFAPSILCVASKCYMQCMMFRQFVCVLCVGCLFHNSSQTIQHCQHERTQTYIASERYMVSHWEKRSMDSLSCKSLLKKVELGVTTYLNTWWLDHLVFTTICFNYHLLGNFLKAELLFVRTKHDKTITYFIVAFLETLPQSYSVHVTP